MGIKGLGPARVITRCDDCRKGEHDNYDDNILLVIIRESGSNRFVKRAYICGEHYTMYLEDGYEITEVEK